MRFLTDIPGLAELRAYTDGELIDYFAEPPSYPDGHVCNYYCRGDEHCGMVYFAEDGTYDQRERTIDVSLATHMPGRTLQRLEKAQEAIPSCEVHEVHWKSRDYHDNPETEVAYRYWFTYQMSRAAISAAVGVVP